MIWVMTNDFPKLGWKVRLWRFQRLSNIDDDEAATEPQKVINQFFSSLLSKSILPQVIPLLLCHLAFRLSISSLEKIFQFPVKTFSVLCDVCGLELLVRYYCVHLIPKADF